MTIYYCLVIDYLYFFETVEEKPIFLTVSDVLVFIEEVDEQTTVQKVFDTLVFDETIGYSPKSLIVGQNLKLVEAVNYGFVKHLSVSDLLSFGEIFAKGPDLQIVHQALFFVENFQRPIVQTLVFVETFRGDIARSVSDSLVLTETIKLNKKKVYHVTDILSFVESPSQFIYNVCPTPGVLPIVPQNHILLIGDENHQIRLRTPNFGNTDKLQDTRISRTSRGNDLIVFRDPLWPRTENFSYKVQLLSQKQVDALHQFLSDSLGLQFALFDWQGFSWNVFITNPQTEITQRGRNVWEVQLDFEVVNNYLSFLTHAPRELSVSDRLTFHETVHK